MHDVCVQGEGKDDAGEPAAGQPAAQQQRVVLQRTSSCLIYLFLFLNSVFICLDSLKLILLLYCSHILRS